MIERVLTIGAYGFNERTFIDALKAAGADLFIDIRARRGMRGSAYAFANATRLQASLEAAGIRYTHAKELAPSESVRDAQRRADTESGIAKRERTRLGPAFSALDVMMSTTMPISRCESSGTSLPLTRAPMQRWPTSVWIA